MTISTYVIIKTHKCHNIAILTNEGQVTTPLGEKLRGTPTMEKLRETPLGEKLRESHERPSDGKAHKSPDTPLTSRYP